MSTMIKEFVSSRWIEENIASHIAWHGTMSGIEAEKLIRDDKTPHLYLLRSGELPGDYYVTFIGSDLTVRHQPFTVWNTENGWCFEQGCPGGPFKKESIGDVIHLIMHCEAEEAQPFRPVA